MPDKFISAVIIILCFGLLGFAKNTTGPRIQLNERHGTPELARLNKTGNYFYTRNHKNKQADLDSAKALFKREYNLSLILHIDTGYGKYESLCRLGEVCLTAGNQNEGRAYFMQAAGICMDNKFEELEADTYERYAKGFRFTKAWYVIDSLKNMKRYVIKALNIYKKLNKIDKTVFESYKSAYIDSYINITFDESVNECLDLIRTYQHTRVKNLEYVYSFLATGNRYKGDLNKALLYALQSVRRMQMAGDSDAAERCYGELGEIYQELGQTEKSIYYYKKCIGLREKMVIPQEYIFRTAGFVAQELIKLNRPQEGLSFLEALEERHYAENKSIEAYIQQIKGYCYEALKDYKRAEKAYLLMMKNYQTDDYELFDIAKYDIAKFYILRKQYVKAATYLHTIKGPENIDKAKDVEYLFFQVDSAEKHFPSAINHFKRYKAINDSMFSVARSKQIEELQIQYQTEQSAKDIKILKRDSLIQQNKAQKSDSIRNLTLAVIVFLGLFLIFLYRNYRINQAKNQSLNKLVTEKDNLLIEKDSLLLEKQWFLKEIHHRVKNNLQIVMGLLQRQAAYIDNDAALTAIQNSENRMHSIALIHQKLYQSESLDLIYMPDYINDFISYLKDSWDLGNRIFFEKQLDDIYLDVSQAMPLGLILNEAVTNAIKYAYHDAEGGIVRISLRQIAANENQLIVEDYGKGLASGFSLEKSESMGMTLMRGLCKQLNGKFTVDYNGGVSISVIFKTEVFIKPTFHIGEQ